MPTLRTRASKGSALTHNELDANFKRTVSQKTTTYSCVVGDNRNIIECDSATPFTVTLGDANTMDAAETGDYEVTIANIGSGAVTVARAGTDTIDGGSTSITLNQYSSVTLKVNSAGTGYTSIARGLGGLTSSVTKLNLVDGFTGTTADLNILSGADAGGLTAAELLYIATLTSDAQTQINTKLATANQAMVFIETKTASSSATIDFTTSIDSTYDTYIIECDGIIPGTTGQELWARVSTDTGSTFVAASYVHLTSYVSTGAPTVPVSFGSASDAKFKLTESVNSTTAYGGVSATIKFRIPSSTSKRKSFEWKGTYNNGSDFAAFDGGGQCSDSTVETGNIDAIRFLFSSGNIASGTFTLYGLRKS